MFADEFDDFGDAPHHPSRDCFAVVPHNVNELTVVPKALYIGTGGDVTVRALKSSADVVFANVQSGAILPVRVIAVRALGTTASDIVGLG